MSKFDFSARRTIRMAGYDYAQSGAYFITVCAQKNRCVFGHVVEGEMRLNCYGEMVQDSWDDLPGHFAQIQLDAFQIMPNHVHGIIVINPVGAGFSRPEDSQKTGDEREVISSWAGEPRPYTLGQMVAYFKYQNTKNINLYRGERGLAPVRVWQRNYYERIIRSEKEWNDTRRYIMENPARWRRDSENPDAQFRPLS